MNEGLVVVVRALIGFFTLLIFTRLLGKQQISQLTFFDYILGITVGSIAATLTTDLTSRTWAHWVGLVTWIAAVLAMQLITIKWRDASKYINGEPTIVIMNGLIMEDSMKKMRYRIDDLKEQLREKGAFNLSEIEFAVLETSGNLSVLKKSQYQPLTPKDMQIKTDYSGLGTELIYNGLVIDKNLKQINKDKIWLFSELKSSGVRDISEVFYAALDSSGELYIDKYKDHITNKTSC
ncbi:DUF421 domain-containing protein [Anaerovorax odorimutans]|uniref:DUF421 domain-containing protein n=1 Tax=Anaerovorax odorimutans TaxID=109327 RepID=UPI0004276DCD|nr:DUF421 domain-containing protein [Anaerovorax odorimutans]